MKKRMVWLAAVGCLALLAPGAAWANRYDLSVGRFIDSTCPLAGCAQDRFHDLMIELGSSVAPAFLAPAETLGLNGFEFALEGSVVPIHNQQAYWTAAAEGSPGAVLFLPRLHVRKGFPFSVELGTQVTYIPESELFALGAEVKWALNEGFYYLPDFAVRVSINHLLGSKDFELSTGGWDLSLSKAFGIAGMFSLTPYAGYNMLFVHASSHVVLDAVSGDPDPNQNMVTQVFSEVSWKDNMQHRVFVGCRLKTHIFQITAEGIYSKSVSLFNFKLGFDY